MKNSDYLLLVEASKYLSKFIDVTDKTKSFNNDSAKSISSSLSEIIKTENKRRNEAINYHDFESRIFDSFTLIASRIIQSYFEDPIDKYFYQLDFFKYDCDKHKNIKLHEKGYTTSLETCIKCYPDNSYKKEIDKIIGDCPECNFYLNINNEFWHDHDLFWEQRESDIDIYNNEYEILSENDFWKNNYLFKEELHEYLLLRQDVPFVSDYTPTHKLIIEIIETKIKEKFFNKHKDAIHKLNLITKKHNKDFQEQIINKYESKLKQYETSKQ